MIQEKSVVRHMQCSVWSWYFLNWISIIKKFLWIEDSNIFILCNFERWSWKFVNCRLTCNVSKNELHKGILSDFRTLVYKKNWYILNEIFISYRTFLSSNANQRLLEHSFFLRWNATAVERYKNVKLLKDESLTDEIYLDGIYDTAVRICPIKVWELFERSMENRMDRRTSELHHVIPR